MAGPKSLRGEAALAARLARIREPHVAPLNALVERISVARGGAVVPWVDPEDGGTAARALFLLENPGGLATPAGRGRRRGSNLISMDNDDGTAAFVYEAVMSAGLNRKDLISWNIVPWYLGTDQRRARPLEKDIVEALPYLDDLLRLLPSLLAVVLLGAKAGQGWLRYVELCDAPTVRLFSCPHPSPMGRDAARAERINAVFLHLQNFLAS